jgi:hypothetical protein
VDSFDAENPNPEDTYTLISHVPVVHRWLLNHKCPMKTSILMIGAKPAEWGGFSVHARNAPLYSIFDEIAVKSHTYFWSVTQSGTHSCAINMHWSDQEH